MLVLTLVLTIFFTSFPVCPAGADGSYTLPPLTRLTAAAFGKGVYMVAGNYTVSSALPPVYNTVFLTSPDGVTWAMQPTLNNIIVDDIAYGNGLFVAVGAICGKGTGTVLTSRDGVQWNQNAGLDTQLNNIVYGNGRFVLLGSDDNYTSTDGVDWTPAPNHALFIQTDTKLVFSKDVFVDLKEDGTQSAISQDGINWQVQDTGLLDAYGNNPMSIGVPTVSVAGLAYGNGLFVAVGMFDLGGVPQGTNPIVITSPDATTCTMKNAPYTSNYSWNIRQLIFGDGLFAAIDRDGDIMTSPDGLDWTARDTGARGGYECDSWPSGAAIDTWDPGMKIDYNTVVFCGNEFVAVGGVTISTSGDGVNWTNQQPNPITFPAQTPVKFVIGRVYYYLGSQAESMSMDASPFISNGRALVPVRYLAIALGAITCWDAKTQTITISKGNTIINMVIGGTTLTVNGKTQTMDVAPEISGGRTYLPAKYVAEALGYTVAWDPVDQTVTVND